jgi:hypothetical protein
VAHKPTKAAVRIARRMPGMIFRSLRVGVANLPAA